MTTMMNIQEYFKNLILNARDDEEMEEAIEIEMIMYRVLEENELDFENWAHEEGIDLTAKKIVLGKEIPVLTLWCWDMEEVEG